MRKLFIALTLILSFAAFSSNANAQTPTAWGIGGLFQTDDANFLLGYTAIETNQPVFQVYDCEVDAFVFANGSLIGAPFSVGLNFAEISFSSPGAFNTLYEMVFQFFLLPVDFCGGTIDYFGFSTLMGRRLYITIHVGRDRTSCMFCSSGYTSGKVSIQWIYSSDSPIKYCHGQ